MAEVKVAQVAAELVGGALGGAAGAVGGVADLAGGALGGAAGALGAEVELVGGALGGGDYAGQLFRTLGWGVMPRNYMNAFAVLFFWAIALGFTIAGFTTANNADDAEKQKTHNFYVVVSLLALIFSIFFAIRTVS